MFITIAFIVICLLLLLLFVYCFYCYLLICLLEKNRRKKLVEKEQRKVLRVHALSIEEGTTEGFKIFQKKSLIIIKKVGRKRQRIKHSISCQYINVYT